MLNRSQPEPQWDEPVLDFVTAMRTETLSYDQGSVSLQAWVDYLRQALWWYALNVTAREFGGPTAMSRMLAEQWYASNLPYLTRWAAELLQQQPVTLSDKLWRVQLYADAGRSLQQRAMVRAFGLPELPFYPGQMTRCRMRCKCRWEIVAVTGGYDCYWRLGIAEHCPTCRARWRAASPLRVRGGLIVDIGRYQSSDLYA